jgi:hypothetical protein
MVSKHHPPDTAPVQNETLEMQVPNVYTFETRSVQTFRMICHSSLLVSKPFSGLPVFREIIANMGTGSRFGFRTGLLFSLLLSFSLFGQTSGDPIGAVTDALRAEEFAKALQLVLVLVQPALQRAPTSAQLWTLPGVFG